MSKRLVALGLAGAFAFAFATAAPAADKAGKADTRFIEHAIEGNLAEVDMGKLAQDKGDSDGVKNFGKTLVDDHGAANDKLKPIADKLGVKAPDAPPPSKQSAHDRLAKLSGAAFDRAFVRAMVADHKKDIADYEKEAKREGDVAQYANGTLPVLRKHLETAESLRKTSAGAHAER